MQKAKRGRATHVVPAPSIILHPTYISVGLISRIFKDDFIMQNVCDWIGSLQE